MTDFAEHFSNLGNVMNANDRNESFMRRMTLFLCALLIAGEGLLVWTTVNTDSNVTSRVNREISLTIQNHRSLVQVIHNQQVIIKDLTAELKALGHH